jgi:hypothetical protein
MHTDRVLEVAAAIRKAPPEAFDMRFYYDYQGRWNPESGLPANDPEIDANTTIVTGGLGQCGTVGCIAGWAVSIFHEEAREIIDEDIVIGVDWEYLGSEILGLTDDEAHRLFMGHWFPGGMSHITNEDAAAYLEHIAANPHEV